ncbi:glycosyltransferase [Streptomyces endophyticus]|uniref:D-inositol 3-phosphate glycosyltransferase n=1 Tax=Streptomyces endophyticus TaxID=714166 RepID=A0ABU6FJ64_9ACTN|nr:glycosyltransferase [Streptomyces endophyticus]MEB8344091.1 glycosyltransferase [Streptomyces endophyticus]
MRIAVVHGFGAPGGEDEAVLDQVAALTRAGHEVRLVSVNGRGRGPQGPVRSSPAASQRLAPPPPALSSVIPKLSDKLRAGETPFAPRRLPPPPWIRRHQAPLLAPRGNSEQDLATLRAFGPDVVHVHNLYPAFGRAWVTEWTGPVVATLRHGPHRGSRFAALQFPWAARGGLRQDPLLRRADRLVVLSEASRDACARAGLPRERLDVLPDFVPTVAEPEVGGAGGAYGAGGAGGAWVCVGPLAPERGVLELLRRWPAGERLDMVGAGPLEGRCRAAAPASVRMCGAVGRGELRRALPGYRGIVLPGRGARGAVPLVYAEALAAGLPVLAFEGAGASAVPRAVRSDGTGTVTTLDAHLPDALDVAAKIFPTLREHCRAVYAKRYGEAVWTERTECLYASLTPRS